VTQTSANGTDKICQKIIFSNKFYFSFSEFLKILIGNLILNLEIGYDMFKFKTVMV